MTAPLFGLSPKEYATAWAREMLAKPPGQVLILDTETCSLNGEVIELAIIDIEGSVLYNCRFNPLTEIEPGAYAVHGLSKEKLAHEPRFDVEYPAILAILTHADRVLTYNAPYDVGCLDETCRLHGVPRFNLRTECIMRRYAQWYGERGRNGYRWQRLTGGDHSALGDARAALNLLRRMAEAESTGKDQVR